MKALSLLPPPARAACLALALASCAHVASPDPYGRTEPPHGYRLLGAVPEQPAVRFPEARQDLELDGQEHPRVLAVGQTPPLHLEEGQRARLYADASGTRGWGVESCVLLEVFDTSGELYASAVVGQPHGLHQGGNRIDNVGRLSPTFDAGEVDLTSKLPVDRPFFVRATALGAGESGKVSDVYLVLEKLARASTSRDMREQ